jgi:hypothetical protein
MSDDINYNPNVEKDLATIDRIIKKISFLKNIIQNKSYEVVEDYVNNLETVLERTYHHMFKDLENFKEYDSSEYEDECENDDDVSDFGDYEGENMSNETQQDLNMFYKNAEPIIQNLKDERLVEIKKVYD